MNRGGDARRRCAPHGAVWGGVAIREPLSRPAGRRHRAALGRRRHRSGARSRRGAARGAAGVHGRHRLGRWVCPIAKCSASTPAIRGSIRRRSICAYQRSATVRPRAVSAAAARQRTVARHRGGCVPAADGSPVDETVHRVPGAAAAPPSTPRRLSRILRERSPRTTRRSVLVSPPGTQAAAARPRGRARLRSQLHRPRAGERSGTRDRHGRAQGQERRRARHVHRAGGRRRGAALTPASRRAARRSTPTMR